MLRAIEKRRPIDENAALRAMFRARKEVFIDLLQWDLPALAGEFEVDQFDNQDAEYLILMGREGEHRASARLLRTDRPHLLGDLYPHLCAGPIPSGPTIREITRFCLDRHQRAAERRAARNQLVTVLAEYALENGISGYTGVADLDWFDQVRRFGWTCEPLGQPVDHGGRWLTGLHIAVEPDTIERLRRGNVYAELTYSLAMPTAGGAR
ncbi:acyl-homoserine-lactone synthase [Hephaestia sp. GCM10023244]|uniref:acyl-homoserine-lactone synthase n=1 Tax=unclassified Hephaestia TaxID=2631281 RepID=UPI002076E500|nr:acyl-homoserine-lactone synthase [Hephaestia sp. MAHUQ-44]MCM8731088.1 autoinducer synthase [Hephaestia sp. MAHUQ-44]